MRGANLGHRRKPILAFLLGIAFLMLFVGQRSHARTQLRGFPPYLANDFDYANFTRFDAPVAPKDLIYQSNGFMALQEKSFGGQTLIIPVSGDEVPTNTTDRLLALEIDAPVFMNSSGETYNLADSPAQRHLTYYADRTVYHAAFDNGPEVSQTVYPVYGKPASVLKIKIEKSSGPVRVDLRTRGKGFQFLPEENAQGLSYGSPRWNYRFLLSALPKANLQRGVLQWELKAGGEASLILTLGEDQQ